MIFKNKNTASSASFFSKKCCMAPGNFSFIQPTEAQGFISLCIRYQSVICRFSDYARWRGPGPIFEPGTGGLQAGTLTTRLQYHTSLWIFEKVRKNFFQNVLRKVHEKTWSASWILLQIEYKIRKDEMRLHYYICTLYIFWLLLSIIQFIQYYLVIIDPKLCSKNTKP